MICHACNRPIAKPSAVVGALTFGPECAKRMGLIESASRAKSHADRDENTMDMFEERNVLTCDKDPWKYASPVTVQSGWRYSLRGDVMTREPVMVAIYPKWQLQRCGALEKDRVKQCERCQHAT